MSGSIQFVIQDTSNAFKERRKLRAWISRVAEDEGFAIGELSFVLMSDESLLQYNRDYLQHDHSCL